MERFRITTDDGNVEQTWVLLPDRASSVIQAEELAHREKRTHVRVYRENLEGVRELILELNAPT